MSQSTGNEWMERAISGGIVENGAEKWKGPEDGRTAASSCRQQSDIQEPSKAMAVCTRPMPVTTLAWMGRRRRHKQDTVLS